MFKLFGVDCRAKKYFQDDLDVYPKMHYPMYSYGCCILWDHNITYR